MFTKGCLLSLLRTLCGAAVAEAASKVNANVFIVLIETVCFRCGQEEKQSRLRNGEQECEGKNWSDKLKMAPAKDGELFGICSAHRHFLIKLTGSSLG